MHATDTGTPVLNATIPNGWTLTQVTQDEPLEILPFGDRASHRAIGTELVVSLPTVKTHVSSILCKLNVQSLAQASAAAEMASYFEELPQFKTAVDQLASTRPQDSARV